MRTGFHRVGRSAAVALAVAVAGAGTAYGQVELIISEVVDGDLSGGLPKYVELTNVGCDTADLSNFSIGNANNDATSIGFDALVLSGSLASGASYLISYENSDSPGSSTFFNVYGFDADNLDQGAFTNGDDTLILFSGAALAGDPADGSGQPVVDIYGVMGVDGTGTVWEYADGYSFRNANVLAGNDGTFVDTEWTFGGAGSLDAADDATRTQLLLDNTTPGTHTFDDPGCGPAAPGACCAPDGTCTEVEAANCADDYQGDNTLCADVTCPVLIGACCDLLGGCTEVEAADCDGTFQGENTLCANVNCLPPPAECPVAKAGTTTTSVEEAGPNFGSFDYYGSGNDDAFGEYGVTTFQFGPADFGGAVADVIKAELTVTVNDRGFSDGSSVELFFTTDTDLSGLTYNNANTNGIDASQFTDAPVSLGVFAIPEMAGRTGGETDTFSLDLSSIEADLLAAINAAAEFQIIVAAVNSADDITYSGVGNTFDPGDPTLSIFVLDCPLFGACCDPLGQCTEVAPGDCTDDYQGDYTLCADTDCPRLVPTVSEWGLAIMSLIGLAAGTILFGRRQVPA